MNIANSIFFVSGVVEFLKEEGVVESGQREYEFLKVFKICLLEFPGG